MDHLERISRVVTAIARATPSDSFHDLIASERDSFRGLRVSYARQVAEPGIRQVRLDQLEAKCALVKSLFAAPHLLFYADLPFSETMAGTAAMPFDYAISLDKHVCEQVRCFFFGKQVTRADEVYKLLCLLRTPEGDSFHYDYFAYLAEEYPHFSAPGNERPLNTVRALKMLDFLDPRALDFPPGQPLVRAHGDQIEIASRAVLGSVVMTGSMRELQRDRLGCHVILLRALQLRWQGDQSRERQMEVLAHFGQRLLGASARTALYFGWKLLGVGGEVPAYFAALAVPGRGVVGKLRAISWELAAFRTAQRLAAAPRSINGQASAFFAPFIASLNGDCRKMVQAFGLRAIIVDPVHGIVDSVFVDELAFETELRQACRGAGQPPQPMPVSTSPERIGLAVHDLEQELADLLRERGIA